MECINTQSRPWKVILMLCLIAYLPCAVATLPERGNFDEIRILIGLDDEPYRAERDRLLVNRSEPWDVSAASQVSWEVGLAAYILNARHENKALFQEWDKLKPGHSRSGIYYLLQLGNDPPPGTIRAFLWEKAWKGSEHESKCAISDMGQGWQRGCRVEENHEQHRSNAPMVLLRAMWRGAADEHWRMDALAGLATFGEVQDISIFKSVLSGDEFISLRYAYTCASRLSCVRDPFIVDLVSDVMQAAVRDDVLFSRTMQILAVNPDPRARLLLHQLIADPSRTEEQRAAAVKSLANATQPEDVNIFRRFLASDTKLDTRLEAIRSLQYWSAADASDILAPILDPAQDPKVLDQVLVTLRGNYLNLARPNYKNETADVTRARDLAARIAKIANDDSTPEWLRQSARETEFRVQAAIDYKVKGIETPPLDGR